MIDAVAVFDEIVDAFGQGGDDGKLYSFGGQ